MSVPELMRLDGRVAVVSGASQNIGLEASRALAGVGAHVVMLARDAARLNAAAADVAEATGATVTPRAFDVSREEDTAAVVEWLGQEFGQVDVLLNNAATTGTRNLSVLEASPAEWSANLSTNLLGPYQLCAGLIPAMLEGRGGSVINVISGAAFRPRGSVLAYGASKAAFWATTQYLAHFCAPKVRVNGLVPGLVQTGTGITDADDVAARYMPEIPMGRVGRPEEIAPAIVYLASDASSYTTGSLMWVNGGRPS
jgi:NAD(P)-dependent dehydrogenase (short-subunit alcohol dehydrogenase family)